MHTHIVLKPYCKWIKTISLAEGKKVSLLIQFDIIPLSEQTNGNFISYVRMHTRCLFIFIWNLAVPLPPHHPAYICVRCKVSPIHKLSFLETANSIRIWQRTEGRALRLCKCGTSAACWRMSFVGNRRNGEDECISGWVFSGLDYKLWH